MVALPKAKVGAIGSVRAVGQEGKVSPFPTAPVPTTAINISVAKNCTAEVDGKLIIPTGRAGSTMLPTGGWCCSALKESFFAAPNHLHWILIFQ